MSGKGLKDEKSKIFIDCRDKKIFCVGGKLRKIDKENFGISARKYKIFNSKNRSQL
jgi:hypothetical protein